MPTPTPTTKEGCDELGWFWDGKKCKRPTFVGEIALKLTRGSTCGGNSRRSKVAKTLKLSKNVRDALIDAKKAQRKRRGPPSGT